MSAPIVSLCHISQAFGRTVALDDISLDIAKGSFTVLLGPSGSGKTTLLNILGGFLHPTRGQLLIEGQDFTRVPPAKRPTTTVFQDYALFPHMTVGGNVGFGLRMRRVPRPKRERMAREMLELVGLDHAYDRRPHELSGGQRQRVALARSLVVEPKVLLLDEPLGALDLTLRRQMQEELKNIQRQVGTTFVHVTHDQEEAMAIADKIVVMNRGRIEDEGEPERIYLRPRTVFAARFMGDNNIITGRVTRIEGECCHIATVVGDIAAQATFRAGEAVVISIRPEHVMVSGPIGGQEGLGTATVKECGFFGTHHQCICVADGTQDQLFKVRLAQEVSLAPGMKVPLSVSQKNILVFAAEE